jgi:hypothetical protein
LGLGSEYQTAGAGILFPFQPEPQAPQPKPPHTTLKNCTIARFACRCAVQRKIAWFIQA